MNDILFMGLRTRTTPTLGLMGTTSLRRSWNVSVSTTGNAGVVKCRQCNASYPWNVQHHAPHRKTNWAKHRESTPPGWISERVCKNQFVTLLLNGWRMFSYCNAAAAAAAASAAATERRQQVKMRQCKRIGVESSMLSDNVMHPRAQTLNILRQDLSNVERLVASQEPAGLFAHFEDTKRDCFWQRCGVGQPIPAKNIHTHTYIYIHTYTRIDIYLRQCPRLGRKVIHFFPRELAWIPSPNMDWG